MSFYPLALLHMDVSVLDIMLEMTVVAGRCAVLYKIESLSLFFCALLVTNFQLYILRLLLNLIELLIGKHVYVGIFNAPAKEEYNCKMKMCRCKRTD